MPIPAQYTERLERAMKPLGGEVYGNLFTPTADEIESTVRFVIGRGLLAMNDIICDKDADRKDVVAATNAVVGIGKYNEATRIVDKNQKRMIVFNNAYLIDGDEPEEGGLPALPPGLEV